MSQPKPNQEIKVSVATGGFYARAQHGSGSPITRNITPLPGMLYINDSDATLWVAIAGQWRQLV